MGEETQGGVLRIFFDMQVCSPRTLAERQGQHEENLHTFVGSSTGTCRRRWDLALFQSGRRGPRLCHVRTQYKGCTMTSM